MTRRVVFTQEPSEWGDGDWTVTVDGVVVIPAEDCRSDDMDIASNQFAPLWEALGITLEFGAL